MTIKTSPRSPTQLRGFAAAAAMMLAITGNAWGQSTLPKVDAKTEAAFAKADQNGDGKLNKDELDPAMAAKFEAMDADKDGALSKTEFAAMTAQ